MKLLILLAIIFASQLASAQALRSQPLKEVLSIFKTGQAKVEPPMARRNKEILGAYVYQYLAFIYETRSNAPTAEVKKFITQKSSESFKYQNKGEGFDEDEFHIESVLPGMGVEKAYSLIGGDDTIDPTNEVDRAFVAVRQIMNQKLVDLQKQGARLTYYSVVSWDSYMTTSTLAIYDSSTGEVLLIGTLFL